MPERSQNGTEARKPEFKMGNQVLDLCEVVKLARELDISCHRLISQMKCHFEYLTIRAECQSI